MKYSIGISLVVGAAIGAVAMQGLHAQATLAAYSISEIEVTDQAGYAPISAILQAENQKSGAKTLARGGKVDVVEGTAPKRVVVNQWKSVDEAKKFYSSSWIEAPSSKRTTALSPDVPAPAQRRLSFTTSGLMALTASASTPCRSPRCSITCGVPYRCAVTAPRSNQFQVSPLDQCRIARRDGSTCTRFSACS